MINALINQETTMLARLMLLTLATGCAGQPNMRSALDSLEAARSSLERAAHNKGGHRVRALELTNQAINEVQMGIQVGAQ
jgi:hypothetical protein